MSKPCDHKDGKVEVPIKGGRIQMHCKNKDGDDPYPAKWVKGQDKPGGGGKGGKK